MASTEVSSIQHADPFAYLQGQQFILLKTFRKSGAEVATVVWFAAHEGKLYITTTANAGKVKRLRYTRSCYEQKEQ